jgi:hypothetical protein
MTCAGAGGGGWGHGGSSQEAAATEWVQHCRADAVTRRPRRETRPPRPHQATIMHAGCSARTCADVAGTADCPRVCAWAERAGHLDRPQARAPPARAGAARHAPLLFFSLRYCDALWAARRASRVDRAAAGGVAGSYGDRRFARPSVAHLVIDGELQTRVSQLQARVIQLRRSTC